MEVVEGGLWPAGNANLERLPELRRFAMRLIRVGDRDAAQDQVRATLTSAARGLLLVVAVFPLRERASRAAEKEGLEGLAQQLELSIYGEPELADLERGLAVLDRALLTTAA